MEHDTNLTAAKGVIRELDLFDFFRYAVRKYKVIAAAALAGLILAAFYAGVIATPVYEATAQLYVVNSKDSVLNLSDLQIGSYLTEDYQLVFDTWEVNQLVIENLDLPYSVTQMKSMLQVENPGNSRVLQITVSSPNAAEVAPIANEYVEVARQYISDTMLTEKPSILSTALQPVNPVRPRKTLISLAGALIGAFAAVWALFVVYVRDDKIKTSMDVVKYTGAMPLAVVPLMNGSQARRSKGRK